LEPELLVLRMDSSQMRRKEHLDVGEKL
jgi:hypothetical protein